jgi:hypothetical protein
VFSIVVEVGPGSQSGGFEASAKLVVILESALLAVQ